MLLSLDRLSIFIYSKFSVSLLAKYYIHPEQENALERIFLKIGAWPNAYKKKVDDARVVTILKTLLTFRFEIFVNAEFIELLMFWNYISFKNKIFSIKIYQKFILRFLLLLSYFYLFKFILWNYSHFIFWISCLPPFIYGYCNSS